LALMPVSFRKLAFLTCRCTRRATRHHFYW